MYSGRYRFLVGDCLEMHEHRCISVGAISVDTAFQVVSPQHSIEEGPFAYAGSLKGFTPDHELVPGKGHRKMNRAKESYKDLLKGSLKYCSNSRKRY